MEEFHSVGRVAFCHGKVHAILYEFTNKDGAIDIGFAADRHK